MGATIDVLLPVYNAAAFLRPSLASLRQQTFADFRVLVLDDGSTDKSVEIAREIAAQDDRFEIVCLPHQGLVETLNRGLSLVSAPFVARQDADDISHPNRFGLQLRHMQTRPELCAISGTFFEMDADGTPVRASHWAPDPTVIDPFAFPAVEPHLPHPFLMATTDAMRRVGGYRHVRHAEDVDLYWRLSLVGRLANLPDCLGLYRMHAKSVSANSLHNVVVQSFAAQLAAISYRRVLAGKPDVEIDAAMADRLDALDTIQDMVGSIDTLDETEKAYLRCAAFCKAVDAARVRKVQVDAAFLGSAIDAYKCETDSVARRRLRSRLWRGIRMFARQGKRYGETLSLLLRFGRAHILPLGENRRRG